MNILLWLLALFGGQHGWARWYDLPGNVTASGQMYDASSLTCASRTLPLGSEVGVMAASGKVVKLTVNDRGPWCTSDYDSPQPECPYIVDLTPAAAMALGMSFGWEGGVAYGEMEVVVW